MSWNPIDTIVPHENKWYLVKPSRKQKLKSYTTAPVLAVTWTGQNWYDGYMFYDSLIENFIEWREIDDPNCQCS